MIEDILEIIVITYNRSSFFKRTLEQLSQSPFTACRITILDNCSSDDTRDVALKCSEAFVDLHVITHRINIGGNPNYLKAIELSSSEYTWILCDDDYQDFSGCYDVVKAIESNKFDLIAIGVPDKADWPRGVATTVEKILEQGLDYHSRMTFFPAYIFRTSLFDSDCFCWGYKNIDRLYPQFEFLNKSIRDNFTIYLAVNKIVIRNESCDHSFYPLVWYASWVTCCRTIPDTAIRYKAIEQATIDRGFYKGLGFWTILDRKINNDGDFWIRIITILRVFNWKQRLKYFLVLPLAFMPLPLSFWVWLRASLYKLMRVPKKDIPPLNFVNRG
jgi:glycosyltransferase involved in cell wall biosynthesis